MYALGRKAQQFALREKYRTCLENIARETLDSVYLVVRSGFDALCIDDIEGRSTIRIDRARSKKIAELIKSEMTLVR
jgi:DNA-binding IclR family transcriptional regulator